MLLPVLGLRAYGFSEYSYVADHNLYFASIGLLLAISIAFARIGERLPQRTVALMAILWVVVLAALTSRQIPLWRNSFTLWSGALRGNPNSALAENNLGMALVEAGNPSAAERHFQQSLRLVPVSAEVHNNLALAYYLQGDFKRAAEQAQQAAALAPDSATFHKNYGLALLQIGQDDAAEAEFRRAVALQPSPVHHQLLARVLVRRHATEEAIAELQRAVSASADALDARRELGRLLLSLGRNDEAAEQFAAIVARDPADAQAHDDYDAALHHAPAAERTDPPPQR